METMRQKLRAIRAPKPVPAKRAAAHTALILIAGIALGFFSKWLDGLALDSGVGWHRLIEAADLGNFFSDIAFWLLAALIIAVQSGSALRAGLNVFVFFAGMCVAYHLYTIVFSGFDPGSYMMIWYALTLLSPLAAVCCWYAKGSGPIAVVLSIGITAICFLSCFAVGYFYVDGKGVLYVLAFIGAVAALYRDPKRLAVTLPLGILGAFLLCPFWPYK